MSFISRTAMGITVLALAVTAVETRAGEWGQCNGYDIKWRAYIRAIAANRNRCTIPDTGPKNAMYWNAMNSWNYAGGPALSFFVRPASDCTVPKFNDDITEVGLVPPSVIPGDEGKTFLRFNSGCGFWTGWWDDPMAIIEADVVVRNDFPNYDDPFEGTNGVQAWDTLVHEVGHMLGGLGHDWTWFSIMTELASPLVGGTGTHATIMPRDRYRIDALYGHSSTVVNVAASPQVVKSPYDIQLGDAPAVQYVCRGGTVNVAFTLLNQSSGVRVGPFHNRVRLSPDFNGHTSEDGPQTFTVAQWDDTLEPWQDKKTPVSFTVPSDFPPGQAMYIYVDVDWWGNVAESTEADNHIKIMKLLYMPTVCW
jgi:hypothetical protein